MSRFFVYCLILLVFSGCVYQAEPVPEISNEPTPIFNLPKIFATPKPQVKVNGYVPREWLPPGNVEKSWSAVIVHHSATSYGNAAIIDKWHREGNKWKGVGYDFVIGNGTRSGDGEVEVTYRWRQQEVGAHCRTKDNWANKEAVGICLVGNFNKRSPTAKQMASLKKLTHFLQKRYGIHDEMVYSHKGTPGARVTECPGRRFSMSQLR
ncbi:MAG: N-acetylmuramoyl-L-alanine amidase [Planctomycetes bacterium]|nr:N-acetylmuramoyl-L-alanine amidase [Planctomycetota bacterium]